MRPIPLARSWDPEQDEARARNGGPGPNEDLLAEAVRLARSLLSGETEKAAVATALGLCSRRLRRPSAAWLWDGAANELALAAVRGLGSRARDALRSALPSIERWEQLAAPGRREVVRRFADTLELSRVDVVDSRKALLLFGDVPATGRDFLDLVGSILADCLDHLAELAEARRRNEQFELGIAWTAHELRAPVLGARAVVERVLDGGGAPRESRALLRQVQRELGGLARTVEELLRWSTGPGTIRRRTIDLVRVVRETARSAALESGRERVQVLAPRPVSVPADALHLRTAIANVLRNALAYSPPGGEVAVSVGRRGSAATVSVRDRGPGVPPEEREVIFDPFVRGRAGGPGRGSRGLGLFIAKRVVEAHGGAIWVEPGERGATFTIRLPAPSEGRQRSGS